MRLYSLLILFLLTNRAYGQSPAIGQWRDHFPFSNSNSIAASPGKIFCSNPNGMFYYSLEDNSINKFTTVHGLSESGVSVIAFDDLTSTLVVGYSSGNIDLIYAPDLTSTNLSDIKRSNIVGDKSIYGIYCTAGKAYLSTGFGIVLLDLTRQEVKETYFIASGGGSLQVNDVTILGDTIYAATQTGVYKAWVHHPFLSYYENWTRDLTLPAALTGQPYSHIASFGNRVFAVYNNTAFEGDSTFVFSPGTGWSSFSHGSGSKDVMNISVAADRILFSMNYNVFAYDANLTELINIYTLPESAVTPAAAIYSDGYYWVADKLRGLLQAANTWSVAAISPEGPYSTGAWQIAVSDGDLWVAPGVVFGSAWINSYNNDFVSGRSDESWFTRENIADPDNILADSLFDFVTVAIDPDDKNHVFAGSMSFDGLVEIQDKVIVATYDESNSSLQSWTSRPGYCAITQVNFDREGNLWVLNGFVNKPVSMRKKSDGSWRAYTSPSVIQGNVFKDFLIGRNTGYKWIAVPTGGVTGGLLAWNDNGTLEDESDDEYFMYGVGEGNGNLPSTDVLSIAEDLDGEIWVGTGAGIAVVYSQELVFSDNNKDAQQILLLQDGNYQYLLETEVITSIAIDGANRKWIGTDGSGVFLMSEDGTEQLHHFTTENSPLPSDQIYDVQIDHLNGEVYFATFKGIVSFRGTATIEEQPFTDAYAFPNPVKPDYEGPIAIKGLDRNAEIRITDIAGNLVFAGKSEGGQAIWYGKNLQGQKVPTGIYTVLANSESGRQKVVAKILFIN